MQHFLQLLRKFYVRHAVGVLTALYVICSSFCPNTKIFIIFSTMYYLALFLQTRSFAKTLLFSFFPFFLFNSFGKIYSEEIIPQSNFFYTLQSGYTTSFIISPFLILLATSVCTLFIFSLQHRKTHVVSVSLFFFFLFTLLGFLSSERTQYMPWYSCVSPFMLFATLVWIIEMRMYLRERSQSENQELFRHLYDQIALLLSSQIIIGLLQMVRGGFLGLFIEQSWAGSSSSEAPDSMNILFSFRPSSLSAHANLMAYQLIDFFGCFVVLHTILFQNKKSILPLFFICFFGWIVLIFFSQSRAAYLALVPFVLGFFVYWRPFIQKFSGSMKRMIPPRIWIEVGCIVFGLCVLVIVPRVLSSLDAFSAYNGAVFRKQFNEEALDLIRQNIFLGVGPAMFVPANILLHPTGVNFTFPFDVHNNFLLLAAENGIPAFFCYVAGYLFLLPLVFQKKKHFLFLFCGILSLFVMAYFHALERFFPLTLIVFFLLEMYETSFDFSNDSTA